jgi:hypothetical protein
LTAELFSERTGRIPSALPKSDVHPITRFQAEIAALDELWQGRTIAVMLPSTQAGDHGASAAAVQFHRHEIFGQFSAAAVSFPRHKEPGDGH